MPRIKRNLELFCLALYVVAASIGAFTGGLWATLGIGGAVILFAGFWIADKKPPLPPRNFALFTLIVLAVFAAELPLSSCLDISLKVWTQLASIFLPLLLLTSTRLQSAAYSRSFIPVVALSLGIGAIALGCELQSGGFLLHHFKKPDTALSEYNRGIAHAVILAFPLFAGLWLSGRKKAAILLAVALLFPAGLTESHTAKLALLVGAACAAAAFYRPLWIRNALALGFVALMGWPFYAQYAFLNFPDAVAKLPLSWLHREEIWDYLSYRIAERPLFGWGLGTTHTLDFTQPHGDLYHYAVQGAPHAHNFVVALWVETGVSGLALGFVFLLWVLRSAYALHASLRPFALGGLAAVITVSLFGFDFWTDALWAAFALSAFVFGMLQQQSEGKENLIHAQVD